MKYFIFLGVVVLIVSCNHGKRYHEDTNQSALILEETFQEEDALADIRKFQNELNKKFKDEEESPLIGKDRKKFKGLNFFPIDTSYRVKATFIRTANELPFLMPTTTSRKSKEVKYGEIHFKINGKELSLNVYQNVNLKLTEEYKNYLFLPYSDLTNGDETYGGGRYIDLSIPESDSIIVDFNKSYNPYCAYNPNYSCPIVPGENMLDTEILAGVKAFKK